LDLKLVVSFGAPETIHDCEVVAELVLAAEVEIVWRVVFPVDTVNSTGPEDDGTGTKYEAVLEIPLPPLLISAVVNDWTVDRLVVEDVSNGVDGEALDVTMAEGAVTSRELVGIEVVTRGGGVNEAEPGTVEGGRVAGVAGGGGGGRSTLLVALSGGPF
jgi:hypothetical protein